MLREIYLSLVKIIQLFQCFQNKPKHHTCIHNSQNKSVLSLTLTSPETTYLVMMSPNLLLKVLTFQFIIEMKTYLVVDPNMNSQLVIGSVDFSLRNSCMVINHHSNNKMKYLIISLLLRCLKYHQDPLKMV
jgi:hypothetical protein